eukprot:757652-Hanusia_phi.AAC.4
MKLHAAKKTKHEGLARVHIVQNKLDTFCTYELRRISLQNNLPFSSARTIWGLQNDAKSRAADFPKSIPQ